MVHRRLNLALVLRPQETFYHINLGFEFSGKRQERAVFGGGDLEAVHHRGRHETGTQEAARTTATETTAAAATETATRGSCCRFGNERQNSSVKKN